MELQTLKNITTILKIFRDKEEVPHEARIDCDEFTNLMDNIISDADKKHKKGDVPELIYPLHVIL